MNAQLGVKVLVCSGTIIAFDPENLHGTTDMDGAGSCGTALAFSQRLLDFYNQELEKMEEKEESADSMMQE